MYFKAYLKLTLNFIYQFYNYLSMTIYSYLCVHYDSTSKYLNEIFLKITFISSNTMVVTHMSQKE